MIVLCAITGIGIMSYLTYIHYSQSKSFCDISQEVSCDVVTTSIYSEIFGIPVSVLGLLYFAAVLFLILKKRDRAFQTLFIITLFALVPSLYNSICILCETSKVLMLIIIGASLWASGLDSKTVLRMGAPVLIAGLVAAGVTYFAQTGTVVKKDYSNFIQCLNSKGVVYYKSVRCSTCRRQEMILGEAYKKLNSIECHPDGENPQPELCLSKKITKTPTFLMESGVTEIKRIEGLQQIKDLSAFANCAAE
ncbi:MAG: hypothetical protein UX24_C0021G0001 [Candidatus Giovannonibacteria bacterium GW2011_GWB1_45_9b]|uniref:Vitamin K epoxide reductase domain-containing protein n=1 Tax=Candidatus Giovannonibacteria bacterium GW2011_GWB1_45_9b TaxID=1618653 RepID=A0A0G1QED9_9BACT|nr:MAG: hypothetical protein UX24_C0021G0001 [Candidatus Giovannonibacteria bacterium GW2011_GWB1_45_9b]